MVLALVVVSVNLKRVTVKSRIKVVTGIGDKTINDLLTPMLRLQLKKVSKSVLELGNNVDY